MGGTTHMRGSPRFACLSFTCIYRRHEEGANTVRISFRAAVTALGPLLMIMSCGSTPTAPTAATTPPTDSPRATADRACDPSDDFSSEFERAFRAIPRPDRFEWVRAGASLTTPCAVLSAVIVRVDMPTVSSPEAVLLFSRGTYVGQANPCLYMVDSVEVADEQAIVTYRLRRSSDLAQAGMTGKVSMTYTYDAATDQLHTSEYSSELRSSQPTCDPATGAWTS